MSTATLTRPVVSSSEAAREHACLCARIAADHKAENVLVLDVRELTPLYDFFVIATGRSRKQLSVLTEEIDSALRSQGEKRLSLEGQEHCTWVVQDYGDMVVHLFNPEMREYYRIEELWDEAKRVDWQQS